MTHMIVIILAPLLVTGAVSVLVAVARSRFQVALCLFAYLLLTVIGPLAYGWMAMPQVKSDWTQASSLAGMIALQRSIEWWGLKLGFLFKVKWQSTR